MIYAKISYELILQKKFTENIIITNISDTTIYLLIYQTQQYTHSYNTYTIQLLKYLSYYTSTYSFTMHINNKLAQSPDTLTIHLDKSPP